MILTVSFIIVFMIQLLFDLYIIMLLLRLLLQSLHANYYNPISQFIITATNFLVKPARRIIPGFKGIDFAIVTLVLILQLMELILLTWLRYDHFPRLDGLLIWAVGGILNQVVNIFFYALLIRVVMNWLSITLENPAYEIVYVLTEPLVKPLHRFIPMIGRFDLTPFVIAFVLKALDIILIVPIILLGKIIALGKFLH